MFLNVDVAEEILTLMLNDKFGYVHLPEEQNY